MQLYFSLRSVSFFVAVFVLFALCACGVSLDRAPLKDLEPKEQELARKELVNQAVNIFSDDSFVNLMCIMNSTRLPVAGKGCKDFVTQCSSAIKAKVEKMKKDEKIDGKPNDWSTCDVKFSELQECIKISAKLVKDVAKSASCDDARGAAVKFMQTYKTFNKKYPKCAKLQNVCPSFFPQATL